MFGGAFLAMCSWLVVPTGGPGRGIHHASIKPVPHAGPTATLLLEAETDAMEPRTRTAVLEIVPLVALPPVVTAVRPPITSVSGSLRDVAGEHIQGEARARVRFVDRSGRLRPCDVGQDGRYTLQSLALGTHWVTVSADGYQAEVTTIDLSADRPRLRLDFTLQQAVQLRVQITTPDGGHLLDGQAARRLVPVATREPLGARFDEAHGGTPLVGRFHERGSRSEALPPECVGVLIMDGELPAWVSLVHDEVVIQTRCVEAGQDEVVFVIGPEQLSSQSSAVRVRVLDALTGLPLHRARVRLSGGDDSERDVLADEQGCATVEGRAGGCCELQVRSRTYAELRLPVEILQAGVTELGTIALQPEVTVAGLVLDLEGRPRTATFALWIVDPTDRSLCWSSRASFQSSEDGSFNIRGLGRHEYVIRTTDDDRGPGADWKGTATVSGNVVLDTRAGSIAGLKVRVRPASRLVQHASDGTGNSVPFRVLDARGMEVAAGLLHGSEPRALELSPGVYRVSSPGAQDTVVADQTVELGSHVVTLALARP